MGQSESLVNISCLFFETIQKIDLFHSNPIQLEGSYSELQTIARMQVHKKTNEELQRLFQTNLISGMTQKSIIMKYQQNRKNVFNFKSISLNKICNKFWRFFHPYTLLTMSLGIILLIYRIKNKPNINNYMVYFISTCLILMSILFLFCNIFIEVLDTKQYEKSTEQKVFVHRMNKKCQISSQLLVEGDIIKIYPTMKIPADIRIIKILSSQGLVIDRTTNGRSGSYNTTSKPSVCNNILKSDNMIFYPSTCLNGQGIGLVVATGKKTIISRLVKQQQQLGVNSKETSSKIINTLHFFMLSTSIFALTVMIIYTLIRNRQQFQQIQWFGNFVYVTEVFVSFVPISLPFQIFTMLFILKFIAKQKKIVFKNILSLEKFRQVNCLCVDLDMITKNQTKLGCFWYDGKLKQINDPNHSLSQTFKSLQISALLSCRKQKKSQFEPILEYFKNTIKQSVQKFQQKFPIQTCREYISVKFKSSDSTYWYQVSVHNYQHQNYKYCLFMKGQVSSVWKRCRYVILQGNRIQIKPEITKNFVQAMNFRQKKGEQIIGFAKLHFANLQQKIQLNRQNIQQFVKDIQFIGFVSVLVKLDVKSKYNLNKLNKAGFQVILFSHLKYKITCKISQQLGLISSKRAQQLMQNETMTLQQHLSARQHVISRSQLNQKIQKYTLNPLEPININRWFSKIFKQQLIFSELNSSFRSKVITFTKNNKRNICYLTNDQESLATFKDLITCVTYQKGHNILKKSADAIILNNSFQQIFYLFKMSRTLFSNLKKSVVYNLSIQASKIIAISVVMIFRQTYVPEICVFFCLQFVVGFIPGICFSLQQLSDKIMTKRMKQKEQKIINLPILLQSYGYIGLIIAISGILSYINALDMYGIQDFQYFQKGLKQSNHFNYWSLLVQPNSNHISFGNTNLKTCKIWQNQRQLILERNLKICTQYEASRYACWAFYGAITICSLFNILICQVQKQSIFSKKWNRKNMCFAAIIVLLISIAINYFYPLNKLLMSRDNNFGQLGIASSLFGVFIIIINQLKNFIISKYFHKRQGKQHIITSIAQW